MIKKYFYVKIVVILLSTVFIACEKDDIGSNSSVINAKNVIGGNSNITTVKAFVNNLSYGYSSLFEIASSKYENNGFTLKLPKTIPSQYLFFVTATGIVDSWEIPEKLLSDKDAKWTTVVNIYGFDISENEIGYFELYDKSTEYYGWYVFADRNFTIIGVNNYNQFDCSLKKGWNIVYTSFQEDIITTTKPSNSNFTWYRYK
jgi:hypothetical protein